MSVTLTERVREQLAYGPCSARVMAKRLNAPERSVSSCLSRLQARRSEHVLVFDRNPTRYVLASWCDTRRREKGEPPRERVNIAGRITVGRGSVWGASLV